MSACVCVWNGANLQELNVSALQSTVSIASASSLSANGGSAVHKGLFETNIRLVVAIWHSLGLLASQLVVRHDCNAK